MSFIDLFSDTSDLYAAARPRYPDELFALIAATAPARRRVWDCGTGNGQAAASLAAQFSEVCGTDPSAEQIAHATPAPNVRYSVQPAEATTFPDRHFDAICVAQALHWFDFSRFFAEARRVAVPDALFAAWGYTWFELTPEFDAAFDATIKHVIARYWPPQTRDLWNGYADVPFPFERLPAPELRIRVRWTFPQFFAYVHTWSATRRCIDAEGPAFFTAARDRLLPLWGEPETVRAIDMPMFVWLGRIN
ncbi:MAG: class I SAM-dependent methyltransferase [Gammaproteobacteria bacterium]|nr:class I SAM-dependent methyltransferase [Gammaproteobacteria bacterium]